MSGAWITDIRHFLDEQGHIPPDLPAVPRYLCAIVAEASHLSPKEPSPLDLRCRRRPGRRVCPGTIQARIEDRSGDIFWECPACGDHGVIRNWHATPWDRRPAYLALKTHPMHAPAGFTPRAAASWIAFPPESRVRMLNNFWCPICRSLTSVELRKGLISRGDLLLKGRCIRCGYPLEKEVGRVAEA
jgi:hypothetical protein